MTGSARGGCGSERHAATFTAGHTEVAARATAVALPHADAVAVCSLADGSARGPPCPQGQTRRWTDAARVGVWASPFSATAYACNGGETDGGSLGGERKRDGMPDPRLDPPAAPRRSWRWRRCRAGAALQHPPVSQQQRSLSEAWGLAAGHVPRRLSCKRKTRRPACTAASARSFVEDGSCWVFFGLGARLGPPSPLAVTDQASAPAAGRGSKSRP